jgi:hypothetical protein
MPRPRESLRPELRDFLDAVVVPALLKKYLAENNSAASSSISVEGAGAGVPYSDPERSSVAARKRK